MKNILFGLLLALSLPPTVYATDLADLTISSTSANVAPQEVFTHSYTVTNIGVVSGKYQTTDAFSTNFIIVGIDNQCYIDTVLVYGVRRQAGVICNGILAPGQSITINETLKAKFGGFSGNVVVNRNHNVQLESSYVNNSAFWTVGVS